LTFGLREIVPSLNLVWFRSLCLSRSLLLCICISWYLRPNASQERYLALHGATLAEGMKEAVAADVDKVNQNVQRRPFDVCACASVCVHRCVRLDFACTGLSSSVSSHHHANLWRMHVSIHYPLTFSASHPASPLHMCGHCGHLYRLRILDALSP
jgi:hypothetical protein